MANTVIGVYDNYSEAQAAQSELLSSGFARTDVTMSPSEDTPDARQRLLGSEHASTGSSSSSGTGIGHFFRQLFGMDDQSEHTDMYSEAIRRGSYMVSVDVQDDAQRDMATDIMNRHDPVDIDERSSQWRSEGWSGSGTSASSPLSGQDLTQQSSAQSMTNGGMTQGTTQGMTQGTTQGLTQAQSGASGTTRTNVENEISIPVIQEELAIGKREVQRGGVRVFQRVTETPVKETVQLREEHVSVERHAVDQPATEADLAAFKDASFELRETAEEAVVAKTARIVEEVVVNKEVTEQAATVSDTVRRSDVEVEKIPTTTTSTTTQTASGDDEFRQHWQTSHGASGGRYEDYAPAYQYGAQAASSEQFKGHGWTDSEADIRSDWERRNPGSTWDKVKDSVRFGWERMTR